MKGVITMSNPKVLNKRSLTANPPNSVYVGRPSPFGNPFPVSKGGRDFAIAEFRTVVENDIKFRALIRKELKGKDLICWCAPLPCHADILLEVANKG